MKLTVEQITDIIKSCYSKNLRPEDAAGIINALFTPTYKPLSALAESRQDCEKIFKLITNGSAEMTEVSQSDYYIDISGVHHYSVFTFAVSINIYPDGKITMFIDKEENPIRNQFALVDFIRSLGYNTEPRKS